MNIKGMDVLEKYFPDLQTAGGKIRIGLYALGWVILVSGYFIVSDHIPTWSIDSQILIVALGFLIMSMFFSRRKLYLEKYREHAFRNAVLHFGIPGLAFLISALAHAGYMNGPFVPRGWWTIIFLYFGCWSFLTGLLLWVRAVLAFGVDNLSLVPVYHPAEGQLISSNIYSILRHPVYAGVIRVMIGLAFLNGNANSLAFIIFVPLGFFGWIRLVEEKELIERFGQSYIAYRNRVPAFWPKIRDLPGYFRFIFTGK